MINDEVRELVGSLSTADLAALRILQERDYERRASENPALHFPWHEAQRWALFEACSITELDTRIFFAVGGNRGGKSALGKGLYSLFMRRDHPLARKLRTVDRMTGQIRKKNDTDPVTVWIAPPTLEKVRQDWAQPSDGYSIKYWLGDLFIKEVKTPDHVFYSRPPGMSREDAEACYARGDLAMLDKTILKSHDQDLYSFESSGVDLVIIDEEIKDEAKWNSILMRVGTPNGSVVMCFTPLNGLTWSYDRFWKPYVVQKKAVSFGPRRWIGRRGNNAEVIIVQFGCADNPLSTDYASEIMDDSGMSEAEKNARLYGEYGYVEGALVPALSGLDVLDPAPDHAVYIVDKLPDIVQWYLVVDPNKSYGGLLSGADGDGNVFFVAEHLRVGLPDREHVKYFKAMEAKYVPPGGLVFRHADPGSAGDQSIINMNAYGLPFEKVQKGQGSVSEGVKRLRSFAFVDPQHKHPLTGKLGAPRLYFYRPGIVHEEDGHLVCHTADQISQARQTDNVTAPPDTPHKDIRSRLDLFDCARYTTVVFQAHFADIPEPHRPRPDQDTVRTLPLPNRIRGTGYEHGFYAHYYDL